jgi:ankyrin repeat protein
MSGSDADREADKAFLRACQQNDVEQAQQLLLKRPDVVYARSASKGYGPVHWAAMGGATEMIEVRAPALTPRHCAVADARASAHWYAVSQFAAPRPRRA